MFFVFLPFSQEYISPSLLQVQSFKSTSSCNKSNAICLSVPHNNDHPNNVLHNPCSTPLHLSPRHTPPASGQVPTPSENELQLGTRGLFMFLFVSLLACSVTRHLTLKLNIGAGCTLGVRTTPRKYGAMYINLLT